MEIPFPVLIGLALAGIFLLLISPIGFAVVVMALGAVILIWSGSRRERSSS